MPRRTSRRPKFLWTASALTIGVAAMSVMQAGQGWRRRRWLRRWGVEGKEHAAEPLQRGQWQLTLSAPRKVPLDVVLADGENRRHGEIPEAGHDCQLDDVEVGVRNLFLSREQLRYRGDEGQRGGLEHRDRLVAGRGDDHPHRLWQNDPPHEQEPRHAQGLGCLGLTLVDGDETGADDLCHISGLVQTQAEYRGGERWDQVVGA